MKTKKLTLGQMLALLAAANIVVAPLYPMWSKFQETTDKYVVQPIKNNPKTSMAAGSLLGAYSLYKGYWWYQDYQQQQAELLLQQQKDAQQKSANAALERKKKQEQERNAY